MSKGILKRIHVNQHNIRDNSKNGTKKPVITTKTYKNNIYGNEVIIKDEKGNEIVKLKYSPDNPLSCGAKVWIETRMPVDIINEKKIFKLV